jgi:tetratricopeptide (TPR) repeat protein
MKYPFASGWPKETAALLLALAAAAFMAGTARSGPARWRAAVDPDALDAGQALVTGYAPPRVDPTDRMPLGPLLQDFAVYRAAASRERLLIGLALGACAAFIFALGEQLGPLPCGLVAVVLWGVFFMRSLPANPAFGRQALYAPFILLSAALLAWRARAPTPTREKSVWLACAAGASLLMRSPLALFLPLLAAYEWGVRRRFSRNQVAALVIIPFMFLLPWIRMNWVLQGRFIPFESASAIKAVVPAALGAVTALDAADAQPLVGSTRGAIRWALGQSLRHPLRYALGFADRLAFIFLLAPVFFMLAAASVWVFRDREPVRQTGLLALYLVLIHAAVGVSEYYLYPLWPLLAALASALVFLPLRAPKKEALTWVSKIILGAGLCAALGLSALGAGVVWAYARDARRRDPRSKDALEEALARRPDDAWLNYEAGGLQLAGGDAQDSIAYFARAAVSRPDLPQFTLGLACAQAMAGQASPLFTTDWTAAQPAPGEAPALMDVKTADAATLCKAAADLRSGRRARARTELEQALSVWAQAQGRSRVHSAGDLALDERLSNFSDSSFPGQIGYLLPYLPPASRLALLAELAAMRPADEGIALFLKEEQKGPAPTPVASPPVNEADVRIEAAQKERASGDRARALSLLDGAAALSPDPEHAHRIALLYQDFGAPQKALALLSALAARYPRNAIYLKDLGICQYGAGDKEAARRSLRAALAADPALAEARSSLAAMKDDTKEGR